MDYSVYVCFLSSDSALLEKHWLNDLAAKFSPARAETSKLGPKVHCEVLLVPKHAPPGPTLRIGDQVFEETGSCKHPQRKNRFATVVDDADDLKGIACSIVHGGTVHVKEKGFKRKNWEFRRLKCDDPEKTRKLLQWFESKRGCGFNHAGFYAEPATRWLQSKVSCAPNLFAPSSALQFSKKERFFCSELCEQGLRECGLVDNTTPSPHPELFFQQIRDVTVPAAPVQDRVQDHMMF